MPLLEFDPILKRIRWGGRRLGRVLGKPIGEEPDYAESWEIADHGDDQSVVRSGPWQGWTLSRLVTEQGRELLGRHAGREQFPLLIKFLDASDRLSVQVHPDDRQAKRYDPRENGKTEAWVILDAEPGSRIYAGLNAGVDRARLRRHLDEGAVEECLHSFPAATGDGVFIPAGTVHAIGEGVLLAEIQQSSDITFRLYDWGRVDRDGNPRELHIDQALDCIDFDRGPVAPVTPQTIGDHGAEELVRCEHFVLQRRRTDRPFHISSGDRCHVLMTLDGSADAICDGEAARLDRGKTVLMPAGAGDLQIEPAGTMTLLDAFLP
ncbi:MAG: type I phosphomannose isomerase catalytic subunit [Planctomycetaceae bacterium]